MNEHITQLLSDYPQLETCADDIQRAHDLLADSFRSGGKLLLAGNGGSAADCSHWAGELLKGFRSRRPLGEKEIESLGQELGQSIQGGLPAIPLPSLVSFATAWSNDCDPEHVFAQGIWALGATGDALAAISTTGNSANILRAAQTARVKGIKVIGLTGRSGGELAALCDTSIRVPEDDVHRVQQLHLPVYHCLCLMIEDEFFPE